MELGYEESEGVVAAEDRNENWGTCYSYFVLAGAHNSVRPLCSVASAYALLVLILACDVQFKDAHA